MKTILALLLTSSLFLCGCANTGKILVSASTTVDHAMQAWAVYVVDGKAKPQDEAVVRKAFDSYKAAESIALSAYLESEKTGDKTAFEKARDVLLREQVALLALVTQLQRKAKP